MNVVNTNEELKKAKNKTLRESGANFNNPEELLFVDKAQESILSYSNRLEHLHIMTGIQFI